MKHKQNVFVGSRQMYRRVANAIREISITVSNFEPCSFDTNCTPVFTVEPQNNDCDMFNSSHQNIVFEQNLSISDSDTESDSVSESNSEFVSSDSESKDTNSKLDLQKIWYVS